MKGCGLRLSEYQVNRRRLSEDQRIRFFLVFWYPDARHPDFLMSCSPKFVI
jgi:hypothetical protein